MKTKRLNKSTRNAIKRVKNVQVAQDYIDTLIGQTVVLKSIPTEIKRAKRLFKIGKEYKIQEPTKKNYLNTSMSVHLKGNDSKIYNIQFMHWMLTA